MHMLMPAAVLALSLAGETKSLSSTNSVPTPFGSYYQLRMRHVSNGCSFQAIEALTIVWAVPSERRNRILLIWAVLCSGTSTVAISSMVRGDSRPSSDLSRLDSVVLSIATYALVFSDHCLHCILVLEPIRLNSFLLPLVFGCVTWPLVRSSSVSSPPCSSSDALASH